MFDFPHTPETEFDFAAYAPAPGHLTLDQTQLLQPGQLQVAAQLSQPIHHHQKRWQVYLNALALSGFKNWLESRDNNLDVQSSQCSLTKPEVAAEIDAVCHLTVGEFSVCLVAMTKTVDEVIALPRAIFDLPEYAAQYYVLVGVQEEVEATALYGFFSYQDWCQYQSSNPLIPQADWTYLVPLNWFDAETDRLLLHLCCLDAATMPLPAAPNRKTLLSGQKSELVNTLPRLLQAQAGTGMPPLWQILTWQQAEVVLAQPQLLRWIYATSAGNQQQPDPKRVKHLSDLLNLLTQPAINVARWLQQGLDEVATQLSWQLLPDVMPATALRSGSALRLAGEYAEVIQSLQEQGEDIPDQTSMAYQDFQLDNVALRLCAMTWATPSIEQPGWTLILVVGCPTGVDLSQNLMLRISDADDILVEENLSPKDEYSYLFARVSGDLDEQFIATVGLETGNEVTWPPFKFVAD
ncbi:MAG: DUF1822 family protein [Microcoleaceae cyanobacterium]